MDPVTGGRDAAAASKTALRHRARVARQTLDEAYRTAADQAITSRLVAWVDMVGAATVGLYAALPGEVDLDPAVAPLLRAGVAVAYPRVEDDTTMTFHRVRAVPTLRRGTPAIREPSPGSPVVVPDTVVLPGLAFDRRGGRLGHGAGYYDRWLAGHPGVRTVGVCHARLLVDEVPMLPHDVRADAVLTEDDVYR